MIVCRALERGKPLSLYMYHKRKSTRSVGKEEKGKKKIKEKYERKHVE